jgi:hypothetical protein
MFTLVLFLVLHDFVEAQPAIAIKKQAIQNTAVIFFTTIDLKNAKKL